MAGDSISGGNRPFFWVIWLHIPGNSYFSGVTENHKNDEIPMHQLCTNRNEIAKLFLATAENRQ